MGLHHAAFQNDGLSVAGIPEVRLPVASPADGSNQAVISGLQIEKRQRVRIGRISAERFHMGASARAECLFERFKIRRRVIAAASMAEYTRPRRSWDRPVQRQDVFQNRRVSGTVVTKPNDPVHSIWEIRIRADIRHHRKVRCRICVDGSVNLASRAGDNCAEDLPSCQQLRRWLAVILKRKRNMVLLPKLSGCAVRGDCACLSEHRSRTTGHEHDHRNKWHRETKLQLRNVGPKGGTIDSFVLHCIQDGFRSCGKQKIQLNSSNSRRDRCCRGFWSG